MAADCILAGTDIFCIDSGHGSGAAVEKIIKENNDGNLLLALRRAVKDNHYGYVNSCAINGMSETAYVKIITPWWQTAAIAVNCVLAVAMLVFGLLWIIYKYQLLFAKKEG